MGVTDDIAPLAPAPAPAPEDPVATGHVTERLGPPHLTSTRLTLLAIAGAVLVANPYYIHPIIAPVAASFGVGAATIGLVPALNQIALAVGILLLLPLGDRIRNRRLVAIFSVLQFVGVAIMAAAAPFWLFAFGSTLLGFFSISPYLLPTYASKRTSPEELGHVTAVLTTGVIGGILMARSGAGVIAEHFGWRTVYIAASVLMLIVSIGVPFLMDEDKEADAAEPVGYTALLTSILDIVRNHPSILTAGAIQMLGFGTFLAVWLGLGLHLTSPAMGYGVDIVGYLALFSAINLILTPRFGRMADRLGAERARAYCLIGQLAGALMLAPFGHSIWLLMIPIVILNIAGPTIDIANRMTFLSQPPAIRTRLMTVYIVMMFTGAGMASWAATAAYAWGGWHADAALATAMVSLSTVLGWRSYRRPLPPPAPAG
jgi:predicted MFS family arabinose efflux permease